MSDLMSVRLHLSGVRVTRVPVDTVDRLEVERLRANVGFGCAGRCVGHDVTRIPAGCKVIGLGEPVSDAA